MLSAWVFFVNDHTLRWIELVVIVFCSKNGNDVTLTCSKWQCGTRSGQKPVADHLQELDIKNLNWLFGKCSYAQSLSFYEGVENLKFDYETFWTGPCPGSDMFNRLPL